MKLSICVDAEIVRQVDTPRKEMFLAESNPQDAIRLANMLGRDSSGRRSVGRTSKDVAAGLRFSPVESIEGSPRRKTAKGAAAAGSVGQIRGFETLTGKVKISRGRDSSLKRVASETR